MKNTGFSSIEANQGSSFPESRKNVKEQLRKNSELKTEMSNNFPGDTDHSLSYENNNLTDMKGPFDLMFKSVTHDWDNNYPTESSASSFNDSTLEVDRDSLRTETKKHAPTSTTRGGGHGDNIISAHQHDIEECVNVCPLIPRRFGLSRGHSVQILLPLPVKHPVDQDDTSTDSESKSPTAATSGGVGDVRAPLSRKQRQLAKELCATTQTAQSPNVIINRRRGISRGLSVENLFPSPLKNVTVVSLPPGDVSMASPESLEGKQAGFDKDSPSTASNVGIGNDSVPVSRNRRQRLKESNETSQPDVPLRSTNAAFNRRAAMSRCLSVESLFPSPMKKVIAGMLPTASTVPIEPPLAKADKNSRASATSGACDSSSIPVPRKQRRTKALTCQTSDVPVRSPNVIINRRTGLTRCLSVESLFPSPVKKSAVGQLPPGVASKVSMEPLAGKKVEKPSNEPISNRKKGTRSKKTTLSLSEHIDTCNNGNRSRSPKAQSNMENKCNSDHASRSTGNKSSLNGSVVAPSRKTESSRTDFHKSFTASTKTSLEDVLHRYKHAIKSDIDGDNEEDYSIGW